MDQQGGQRDGRPIAVGAGGGGERDGEGAIGVALQASTCVAADGVARIIAACGWREGCPGVGVPVAIRRDLDAVGGRGVVRRRNRGRARCRCQVLATP